MTEGYKLEHAILGQDPMGPLASLEEQTSPTPPLRNLPITQSIDLCKDVPYPYILFSTVIYCYLFHSFSLLTTITMECTLLFHNRPRYCSVWTEKPRTLYN